MIPNERIEKLRQLLAKATLGPWKAVKGIDDEPDRWCIVFDGPKQYLLATIENGHPGDTLETEGDTANLIAESCNSLPSLLAELERLREVVGKLRVQYQRCIDARQSDANEERIALNDLRFAVGLALVASSPQPTVATINTGDSIYHKPSGETWLVAYCEDGRVCCCGWPCSLADVSDCELKRKATPEQRLELLKTLAAMKGDDSGSDQRRLYAARVLESSSHQSTPTGEGGSK